jgi:ubiquinol-cytochrome c reductase iron-sulfur subunit
MLAKLAANNSHLRDPDSAESEQPAYAKNGARSMKPEYLVLVGVCTHLGCAPLGKFEPGDATVGADWPGGFYCPCHGSKFDLAGRVFKDVPAPLNLAVPPYTFGANGTLVIGADTGAA